MIIMARPKKVIGSKNDPGIAPYPFRYGQYRTRDWWREIRTKAILQGLSVNELIVVLLEKWRKGN